MRFIKIFYVFLAAILILSGCEAQTVTPPVTEVPVPSEPEAPVEITEEPPFTLRIPFDYNEGVSPYTTKSKPNRFVCELIYRSMVTLKDNYSYELDLVSEIYTEDNITWYIYLDEGETFPDGTEFTAYDLRYSFQEAMEEDSFYSKSLEYISSIKVVNATCLRVTLYHANRYFPNLLTFPVISFETEDDPLYFPGIYDFSEDGTKLVCDIYSAAQEIELVPAEDMDLLTYEMKMGRYDCIYVPDPLDSGSAGNGANHDGLGIDIQRNGADRMGDAVQIVLTHILGRQETLLVIGMLLRVFGDLCHCLNCLHRIFAGSRLAGQHHAGCSVIDSICHVRNLSTGGSGILDHGLQHFSSGNNALTHHAADPGQLLLDRGNLHIRNFHTQITTGNHNAATVLADLHDVIHTGTVLNLCNHFNIAAAVFIQQLADIQHILLCRNERSRHKVHTLLNAKDDILLILLTQVRTGHDLVGEGHTLAVA